MSGKNSIVTDNMNECFICKTTKNLELHHIFHGTADRKKSDKEGLVVMLCNRHHTGSSQSVHQNAVMDNWLKEFAQRKYEQNHSREEFMNIFHKNYIKGE